MRLIAISFVLASLARASGYYPDHYDAANPPPLPPDDSPDTLTSRIAWLEYLAHVYIEVYNYPRAQRCIDEMRRLSGMSLADASLARLAIDGVARRMHGFRRNAGHKKGVQGKDGKKSKKRGSKDKNDNEVIDKSDTQSNRKSHAKHTETKAKKPAQHKSKSKSPWLRLKDRRLQKKAAKQHAEQQHRQANYWEQVMVGGEHGLPGSYRVPQQDEFYQQGARGYPGPAHPIGPTDHRYYQRLFDCPACPPYPPNYRRGDLGPLRAPHQLIRRTMAPNEERTKSLPRQEQHSASTLRDAENRVYQTHADTRQSTDDIHKLLFQGRLEEANAAFARLIRHSTSPTRPVYRIELVLSLIDLDLTDPNDCVALWDASWRLPWQEKLRTVDLYRSCKHAVNTGAIVMTQPLFAALNDSPFRERIEARIKTIVDAPDALDRWSRVPSKADFYLCGVCWARRHGNDDGAGNGEGREGGMNGLEGMRRLMLRAEHDADLPPPYRRYFGELLKASFTDRYDPRVSTFSTVYPREVSFSSVTGHYSGLYRYRTHSFPLRHRPRHRLGNYRPLKNPNPIPGDRQQVLLEALADGSPEQLANMMYEGKHQMVRQLVANSTHLNLDRLLEGLDREGNKRPQRQAGKKKGLLQRLFGRKKDKSHGDDNADDEMEQYLRDRYQALREEQADALEDLADLLQKALDAERPIDGVDDYNMSLYDYSTMPLNRSEHRALIKKIEEARRKLERQVQKARKAGMGNDERKYEEQLEYLDKIEAAQEALRLAQQRLGRYEANDE